MMQAYIQHGPAIGGSPLIPLILILPLLLIPVARILRRTGHNPWWCLLVIVPFVNLLALWLFAYAPWPSASGGANPPPARP